MISLRLILFQTFSDSPTCIFSTFETRLVQTTCCKVHNEGSGGILSPDSEVRVKHTDQAPKERYSRGQVARVNDHFRHSDTQTVTHSHIKAELFETIENHIFNA